MTGRPSCVYAREGIEPKRERPVTLVSAGLPRHDPQARTAMAGLLESALPPSGLASLRCRPTPAWPSARLGVR